MKGGCLCGAVRYESTGKPNYMALCFCRDCQKATGSSHLGVISVPKDTMTITGETKRYAVIGGSGKPIRRHFCGTCGSLVFGELEAVPGTYNIAAMTLDDTSAFAPQLAVYVKDRPAWACALEKIPGHETSPITRKP